MTVVLAGDHGDLAQTHADMGPEALFRHLLIAHGKFVDPDDDGAAVAQQTHRMAHGDGHPGA